jgi:hypothetical protein
MNIEVTVNSLDGSRPNEALWRAIEAKQTDLLAFLQEGEPADEPAVETAKVTPLGGFPTGVEPFVIVVAITFVTAFAKGFAEGTGKEIGEAAGGEAGKRLGARIRLWLRKRFPDVEVHEK